MDIKSPLFDVICCKKYMYLEHNSQELFYRNPFGAVKCSEKIEIKLLVCESGIPHSVKCYVLQDNKETLEYNMPYIYSIKDNSIYSVKIDAGENPTLLWYYFKVESDFGIAYYANNSENLGGIGEMSIEKPTNLFQITVYDKNYDTPDWFKESIVYQIFPDRFYNGNKTGEFLGDRTDIIKRNWNDEPFYKPEQFGGEYLSNDFFGGNLLGVIKKLSYLSELGVNAIYLNPIFKAYSNHKYDTGNYEEIDPMFGDEETFICLCKAAHNYGIKVILDGVFNHTGSNSKYFNKNGEYSSVGAYQSEDSPYYEWYSFGKNHDEYECWWGMKTLPHVRTNTKSFCDYILNSENSIVKKWLRLGADGFRLDVVDELPDSFVKQLRKSVKETKKDAVIIGEVWEDASNKISYSVRREYFLGSELDSVMNYPLRSALIDAALNKIDSLQFNRRIMSIFENYPVETSKSLLNILSGHDVERIITLLGDAPAKATVDRDFQSDFRLSDEKLALSKKRVLVLIALLMTFPGAPCIYYGDEIATEGYADPFSRRTFRWENTENNSFLDEIKKWIMLRKSSEVFSHGSFTPVYYIENVYGFIRELNGEKYVILVNFSSEFDKIRLDLGRFNISSMKSVMGEEERKAEDCVYWVDVPEHWVKVFHVKND